MIKPMGLKISVPYLQDDLVWCIQKAKNYPLIYQWLLISDKYGWFCGVFLYGYGCGTVLYILISLDKHLNKGKTYDFHYVIWQITLTAFFTMAPKFKPSNTIVRIFYGMMLTTGLFISIMVGVFFYKFLNYPQQKHQITTTDEIVDNNFRLVGTQKVLELIEFDSRVRFLVNHYSSPFHFKMFQ